MITHLFFDLGSTLIDESACVNARIEAALRQPGAPPREVFIDKIFELAAGSYAPVKVAADFFGLDVPHWDSSLEAVYPEAFGVLEKLSKRYSLGIIANQSAGAEQRMAERGIRKYFDMVTLSAEEGVAKPDLRIFKIALERAGCRAENAAMIGDRPDNDIAPAKLLGMTTVRVLQGMFAGAALLGPETPADHTVRTLNELLGIL